MKRPVGDNNGNGEVRMSLGRKAGFGAAAVLASALALAVVPADANDRPLSEQAQEEAERARRLIEEALANLVAGLKLVMDSIPQYEAPEILENGDILIRRKRDDRDQDEAGQDI